MLSDAFSSLADLAAAAVTEGHERRIQKCLADGTERSDALLLEGVVDFWREEWIAE